MSALEKELLDWAESLPAEQQQYATEYIPILIRMGRERVIQFMELHRARKRSAAFKLILEAMTPSEIVADQLAASPGLQRILLAAVAGRKAREKAVDDLFALVMRLAIAFILKV